MTSPLSEVYIFGRIEQPVSVVHSEEKGEHDGRSIIILRQPTSAMADEQTWSGLIVPGMLLFGEEQRQAVFYDRRKVNGQDQEYLIGNDDGRSIYGDAAGFWGKFGTFATALSGPFRSLQDFIDTRDQILPQLQELEWRADQTVYAENNFASYRKAILQAAKASSWDEVAFLRARLKQEHPSFPVLNKVLDSLVRAEDVPGLERLLLQKHFYARPPEVIAQPNLKYWKNT